MKNTIAALLLIALVSCDVSSTQESNRNDVPSLITEFENQLKKDIDDDDIGGSISYAVIKGDKILGANAVGPASIDSNVSADTPTIYRTGSISKSFTAFLMMQAVQDGIIQLDDPVENYFPEIRNLDGYSDSRKITFQQLASHTSGLVREPDMENAASGPIEEWENKILASIPNTRFQSELGERYSYSNIGFGILGLAVSRAANVPFMEMVEERIFEPLNMTNSFFVVPDDRMKDLSKGLAGGPTGEINSERPALEHDGRGYKVPNGGIYSTPLDLAKFMMCNMGYMDLLSEDNLTQMQTIQTPEGRQTYGLGFSLYQDDGISTVGHGGSVAGYTAYFIFDKESQYGVILMRNFNFGNTNLNLRSISLIRKLKKLAM